MKVNGGGADGFILSFFPNSQSPEVPNLPALSIRHSHAALWNALGLRGVQYGERHSLPTPFRKRTVRRPADGGAIVVSFENEKAEIADSPVLMTMGGGRNPNNTGIGG